MAAAERGPTETGNEMAPEHPPLAHSHFASGLKKLCAYAPEFSRVYNQNREPKTAACLGVDHLRPRSGRKCEW